MMNNQPDRNPPLVKEESFKQAEAQDQATTLDANKAILTEHLELVIRAVRECSVNPRDLTRGAVHRTPLPHEMKEGIVQLHTMIRSIITSAAKRIQERRYRSLEDAIDEKYQVMQQKERANILIAAEKQVNTSTYALRLAVSHFVELNRWILERLKQAQSVRNSPVAREFVLANAILVYELCDFVIESIERFQIAGFNELQELKREAEQSRQQFRQALEKRKKQAQDPSISDVQRKKALEHIRLHEEALQRGEDSWQKYWNDIEKINQAPQVYIKKLPDLRLIRDLAGDRLDLMTLMDLDIIISADLENLNLAAEDIMNQLEMPAMTPELFMLLMEPSTR